MTNTSNEIAKTIRENVFKAYSKHKDDIDKQYSYATDSDFDTKYEKVEDEDEKNRLFSKTDILILTANKYERNILHYYAHKDSQNKIKEIEIILDTAINRFNNVTAYFFNLCGYSVLNIHSSVTGAYTNGGAADVVRFALNNDYLHPAAVISFGICFGTKEFKSSLGDVVISEKVYPYFIGAKVDGDDLRVTDNNMFCTCESLAKIIRKLILNNKLNKSDLGFNVIFGNYITGEAVVSSEEFRDRYLKTTTQPIHAGDMEAYGVFRECNMTPHCIPCVVLKSICDWGIEKNISNTDIDVINEYGELVLKCSDPKSIEEKQEVIMMEIECLVDKLQAYAAYNSYVVLKILLINRIFNHSSYYMVVNEIERKKKEDGFQEEPWTSRQLKDVIKKYLSANYAISKDYVKSIAANLVCEDLVAEFKPTAADGFTFMVKKSDATNNKDE